MDNFQLIKTTMLTEYLQQVHDITKSFEALKDAEASTDTFSFYTSVSAIASAKIEGETLGIDSYVKHKMLNIDYQNDLVEKPNDLYNAYLFAQSSPLTKANFLNVHKLISKHLLKPDKQGKYRKVNMLVMQHKTFKIQFEAALWTEVEMLMKQLWKEIQLLLQANLNHEEVFYYAAFIHLVL